MMAGLELVAAALGPGDSSDGAEGAKLSLKVGGVTAVTTAVGVGIGKLVGSTAAMVTGGMIGFCALPMVAVGGAVAYGGYKLVAIPFERDTANGRRVREIQVQVQQHEDAVAFTRMDRVAFDRFIQTLAQHPVVELDLAGLRRVRRWVWNVSFSGADLSLLARQMSAARLERINISAVGLTEAAANDFIATLRTAPNLQTINVSGNPIKTAAFTFLCLGRSHGRLNSLEMNGCGIVISHLLPDDEGMPLLANGELQQTHPFSLAVKRNPLTGSRAEMNAVGHYHGPFFNRVRTLDITRTKGSDKGLAHSFGRFFNQLQSCVLDRVTYSSRQLASLLQQWGLQETPLRLLDMSHVRKLDDDFFTEMVIMLGRNQTLTNLSLSGASLDVEDPTSIELFANAIKAHRSLQQVDCKGVFTKKSEITAFYHGFDEADGSNRGEASGYNYNTMRYRPPTAGAGAGAGAGVEAGANRTITILADWGKLEHLRPKDSGCSIM